jgi:hypothetical protein
MEDEFSARASLIEARMTNQPESSDAATSSFGFHFPSCVILVSSFLQLMVHGIESQSPAL